MNRLNVLCAFCADLGVPLDERWRKLWAIEVIDRCASRDWLLETPAPVWAGNCFTMSWPESSIFVSGQDPHMVRIACAEALEGVTP